MEKRGSVEEDVEVNNPDSQSVEPFLEEALKPPRPSSALLLGSTRSLDVVTLQVDLELDRNETLERKESVVGSIHLNKKLGWRRYLGVVYTILSVNMLSLTTTILKKFSHIHFFVVGVWLSPAAILLTTFIIIYTVYWEKKDVCKGLFPMSDHKKDIFFLWVRAVLSSVISYITIKAFQYVSAADVRTVVAAAVIMVYIFGWIFLGEKCGVVPILVALVALCGIGIMTRPPALTGAKEFDTKTLTGIFLAFCSMVVISINLVIIRYLSALHHGITNLCVYIWGVVQGLILAFIFEVYVTPTFREILALSFAGICLALALAFLVLALQREEAGVVALVRTSEVIFVFFWQWVIVGTYPDWISIAGATLVIMGVLVVTLRKWIENLPSEKPLRKRLAFLLL